MSEESIQVAQSSTPSRKPKAGGGFGVNLAKRAKMSGEAEEEDDSSLTNWHRPALPVIDTQNYDVEFMLIESDYYILQPQNKKLVVQEEKPTVRQVDEEGDDGDDADLPTLFTSDIAQHEGVIRVFGVTREGHSVCAHIHGFHCYLYIKAWAGMTEDGMRQFSLDLNTRQKTDNRFSMLDRAVLKVSPISGKSVWGYSFGKDSTFLEITLALPTLMPSCRELLQKGFQVQDNVHQFTTYESNIPYVLRFLVDLKAGGGTWMEAPATKYTIRDRGMKVTSSQLEIDIDYNDVVSHESTGKWMDIAPLRVLSFDIECASRKGHFPTPDIDPVIQIATCIALSNNLTKPIFKAIHTLDTCDPVVGAHIFSSAKESDMLLRWRKFFSEADPDVVIGYNTTNFDFPYLVDRAKHLKVAEFPFFGRVIGQCSKIRDTTFSSKAFGTLENKEMSMEGRVQFDILVALRRDYKLSSYTLNAVSAEFLKQQKEDVHHSEITGLQNGDSTTRKRLAEYCLKDAILPLRLMNKLMLLVNYVEMARVTGVPLMYLLQRGQSIKVVSQILRKAKEHGMFVPVMKRGMSDDKFDGATVLEPMRGYHKDPIATLDFASLYPSIMMAHNLCYTSLLTRSEAERLSPSQYTLTPHGDYFVKPEVHKGLLPEILDELLKARKVAKRAMGEATDDFTRAVLNGRQLALKISANSVYGFTGAQVGQLPCLAISSSVTSFGRVMIEHTKDVVEKTYTKANGYEHDATVIYGDTDSVMVRFGTSDLREAMRLGEEAARIVSKEFISPIKLEFEKVYWPYLLMNKKKYAGLYWTKPEKFDKIDSKGIETVRRDNCALVRTVVNDALQFLLVERSEEKAVAMIKQNISDQLCNKIDLSLLVITKSLGKGASSKDYAAKQPHVEQAERLKKRDPSNAPVMGDRVPYVVTRGVKNSPVYERSEDPLYVIQNDVQIDVDYYLEQQLRKPLERIFAHILDNVNELFEGEHTRKVKNASSGGTAGILKFAKKVDKCLGCKTDLPAGRKATCVRCDPRRSELFVRKLQEQRQNEETFGRLWTECQRCQGSLNQQVLCTSRDCHIFYRRKRVQKDLDEVQDILDKFSM